MKVIVNRCFGGASLSPEAVKMAVSNGVPLDNWEFENETEGTNKMDLGDGWSVYQPDHLMQQVVHNGRAYSDHLSLDIKLRTNAELVKVVESLGKAANGRFANLEIVNVPNGVDVEVDEYDGSERVDEVHRSW